MNARLFVVSVVELAEVEQELECVLPNLEVVAIPSLDLFATMAQLKPHFAPGPSTELRELRNASQ
jgi:hypothetical protein